MIGQPNRHTEITTLYIYKMLATNPQFVLHSNKCSPVLHNAEGYVREIIQSVKEKNSKLKIFIRKRKRFIPTF